ncbi:hypothetical protein [Polaribacter sp. KT25b]|uniref:hypothetical protein n=1 Tax=Polaribacter sp. KT25b TaxID=1855336 RepID=UPI000B81461A|nr:hypothetical protein [Polaribacter sp. KT25b]
MYNRLYKGMEIQESRILNETTTIVRFKEGVLHLIHQEGIFKTHFFEEVPIYFFEGDNIPDMR